MQTFENRPRSVEDAEKVVAKKPYAAPLPVELGSSETKNGGTIPSDGSGGQSVLTTSAG